MKFQLKAIAAAVALAAIAGHASAAVQPGTTAQGATGSELLFYAYDDVTKTSYVKDLGVSFASFISNPTYASVNIASDANWISFLGSVGGNTSNTKWGVFATEKTSALAANGVNILTTARDNAPANTSTSAVRGIDPVFNTTYLSALNGSDTAFATNSSYFQTGSTNNANFAVGMGIGHNYNGKVGFQADNAIGVAADFYRLSAAAAATANATRTTLLTGDTKWLFNGTTLQVTTAVPEPESYAMFLAGLGLIGSMVRRRKLG